MTDPIVVSMISGGVTAFGSILGFIATMKAQKKKAVEEHIEKQKELQKSITDKLDAHREEYLNEINNVYKQISATNDSLSDMRAQTQSWQAVMEVKFDNLEKKVMKHNNFMERVAVLEKDVAVLNNREKVSENRLRDLENESN